MKFHRALIGAAAAAALVIPLGSGLAGAVTTTSLTVVDAYQYSSENLMDHTICLDGTVVHDGSTVITSGISTTPGSHTIVVNGPGSDCTVSEDSLTGTVSLADTAAQTLVINWPDSSGQVDKLVTTRFTDDLSCAPAATSRIVFRNVASRDGFVGTFGSTKGPEGKPLISDIALGDEGVASVPAGTFPGPGWTVAGGDSSTESPMKTSFTTLSLPAGSVATVYAIGGNDGFAGMFQVTRSGSVCDATTETTAPPTTVAPAAIVAHPATPVVTQPTYTG